MRSSWIPALLLALAACSNDGSSGPGTPPDTPSSLSSTSLDGAIALTWDDNPYRSDPANFQNYRIFSTSYSLDQPVGCGSSLRLEGTTVAPEFVVGALTNGVPLCFAVTAVSVDGFESDRSPFQNDTPRPDSRNVVLFAIQTQNSGSGFRFFDDLNHDGHVDDNELGLVRSGTANDIDFFVDRDGSGDLFITPVRSGTGVEYYNDSAPVEDLTSIDFAEDRTYRTSGILAIPGYGYVFEMDGGDGFKRYGAVRVTHVGQTFLILDWAFQPDPGDPELVVVRRK
jgi:hypothetical protein